MENGYVGWWPERPPPPLRPSRVVNAVNARNDQPSGGFAANSVSLAVHSRPRDNGLPGLAGRSISQPPERAESYQKNQTILRHNGRVSGGEEMRTCTTFQAQSGTGKTAAFGIGPQRAAKFMI